MKTIGFGEILWDCLPHGNFLGGAPFNVAHHLQQLGAEPVVVSAVGRDEFGREALTRIRARGIATSEITEHPGLPTGTVNVQLDARGNASYVFTDPAAWDRINASEDLLGDVSEVKAVVFGSLALRHEFNRASLDALLAPRGPLKVFDVNLRPPYDDAPLVLALTRRVDVLKLNDGELAKLTGENPSSLADEPALIHVARQLATAAGCRSICVTRGERGALWLRGDVVHTAAAPRVTVRDTIGAGDAFTAALTLGLVNGEARRSPQNLLARACRLGAFVASCDGAQPEYDAEKVLAGAA
ncbi:MAG: carbohydrate kinase [Verrucomicrobia bacterium]|nr:carbohydrate kinase [Verrucomicrobiota bacterium]